MSKAEPRRGEAKLAGLVGPASATGMWGEAVTRRLPRGPSPMPKTASVVPSSCKFKIDQLN